MVNIALSIPKLDGELVAHVVIPYFAGLFLTVDVLDELQDVLASGGGGC